MRKKHPEANLGNPNNAAYWKRLGYTDRPKNWKQLAKQQSPSKRSQRRQEYIPMDGGYTEPFWEDDY